MRMESSCVYPCKQRSTPSITLPFNTWSTRDLQLIHHFSACCCVSIPQSDHLRRSIWTNEVVDLSFSHPFLLHQILAVAALHSFSLDKSDKEAHAMSLAHRARAVEYVQPAVLDLVSQSSPAMFAFAGLTTIYSFAEATLSSPKEDDWIQHILDCFRLNRGISAITRLHREGLQRSALSPLL